MVIGTSRLPNIILSVVCIWEQSLLSGPEEQITNVLVLLKGLPPKAAPSGGRDGLGCRKRGTHQQYKVRGLSCLPASHYS